MTSMGNCNAERYSGRPVEFDIFVSAALLAVALALTLYVGRTAGAAQLIAFAGAALVLWLRRLPELTHPLVWFVPPFAIYSISFPMLGVVGLHKYDEQMAHVVWLHAIALIGFAIPCIWSVRRHPRDVVLKEREWRSTAVSKAGLLAVAPITVALLGIVYVSGATTKRQLIENGGIASSLAQFGLWLTIVTGTLFIVVRVWQGRRFFWEAAITTAVAVLALLIMGERDFLLRLVLMAVLVAWDRKRQPSLTMTIAVGIVGFASLPALQAMKAIALGNPFVYTFDFFTLFDQEFRSMGKNSWVVLSDGGYYSIYGWDVLRTEVTRIFASDLLGIHGQSMTAWYNATFFGNPSAGKGFSLVATSYLLAGGPGVLAVYGSLGTVICWLYRRRCNSVYAFALYLFAVPEFIYAQRADISNFVGPMLKSILLPLAAIAIGAEFLLRRRASRTQCSATQNWASEHART